MSETSQFAKAGSKNAPARRQANHLSIRLAHFPRPTAREVEPDLAQALMSQRYASPERHV